MMLKFFSTLLSVSVISLYCKAQTYPRDYFRNPLNIPMQLVANFGEIRTNHWHMGLDIRTQQRVNLPVHAAAEGYVARVVVEPGGFGQAIYINHPNGLTTLYAHLNSFYPALAEYVKQQQYAQESWKVDLQLPANLFPVKKGQFIALSGNTGGSQGPHVHFEIRDSRTERCLNPLLFNFPIPDAVAPTILRLALYDRNKSTYDQRPQLLGLKKAGAYYTVATSGTIKVGSDKISFALGTYDRLSGSNNPIGVYCAEIFLDDQPVSLFRLDDIDYNESRYINAQLDYPYKARGGASLQHLSPLPGAAGVAYDPLNGDGIIHLDDEAVHTVLIQVLDANKNTTRLQFNVQYDASLAKNDNTATTQQLLPNNLNIFEEKEFELFTTEASIYDTVNVSYSNTASNAAHAVSALHSFLSDAVPSHDYVTVRIRPSVVLSEEQKSRVVIKNISGSRVYLQKADWQNGWLAVKFRQFGTFQAFIDSEPPTINAPATNLSKASRIVFTPKDNFNSIKNFRAELDGRWLRFTNDKGKTWIYSFDEKFSRGEHELKVIVEDEAGNVTTKVWNIRR
jgi:hypothetical protein